MVKQRIKYKLWLYIIMKETEFFLKVWDKVSHTKTNLRKLADWFEFPLVEGESFLIGNYSLWGSVFWTLMGPEPVLVSSEETNTGSWKEYYKLLPGTTVLHEYEGPEGMWIEIIHIP